MWKASALALAFLVSIPGALADPARYPFGQEHARFPAGTLRPSESVGALDRAVGDFYDQWRTRYLIPGCAPDELRVKANAGSLGERTTVSEGQGFGMVIVVRMARHERYAQRVFDALYRFARRHRSVADPMLMGWSENRYCQDEREPTSATDGDLNIAYALLLADTQWGSQGAINYRQEAQSTLEAIRRHTLDPATGVTLLGDWAGPDDPLAKGSRTSDWMIDHFRAFAALDPINWTRVVEVHLGLVERLQRTHAPETGLLPDFVADFDTAAAPAPPHFLEAQTDGDYSWNAGRTAWLLGTDALVSGDPRSQAAVRKMTNWITAATGGDPGRIVEGYRLDGSPIGIGPSMAFTAPFALAAMNTPGAQAWLDALWAEIVATPPEDYYADSIKLQVMMAVAGAWWPPEPTVAH